MKMYFDCIHCFVRQTLDAVRLFTDNEEIHEQVLRKVLSEVSTMDFHQSPPAIAQGIHRMIREHLGEDDPYRRIKDRCNYSAMKLYPELKMRIEQASDSFEMAVRYAIAGNIIDFGVHSQIDDAVIHDALDRAVRVHIPANSLCEFRNAVELADDILYLGDNAGEIVFDRLLIEQLPCEKVTYAVRGRPIINDATFADAQFSGITELVEVIDNGSDAPGTLLDDCSQEFCRRFEQADLIIAKGQGNYESLSSVTGNIVFVLMVKCPVIARDIGCDVGSFVLKSSIKELTVK